MVFRFFLLLLGFGLAVGGGVVIILYMNLIPIGDSFAEYLSFIVRRGEFYLLVVGILLIWGSVSFPLRKHKDHK